MRRSTRVVRAAVVVLAVAGLSLDACDADLEDLDTALEEAGVTEDVEPDPQTEEPEATEEPGGTEEPGPQEAEPQEGEPEDAADEQGAGSDADTQDAGTDAQEAGGGTASQPEGGVDQVPEADLPGQDASLYYAEDGHWVSVVGVEHDDVLNVRALPDPSADIVGEIPPFAQALLAGRERSLGSGARWVEVRLVGGYGWVNGNFLAHAEGEGEDVTADFSDYGPYANIDDLIDAALQGRAAELPSADGIVARHLDGASSDAGPGAPIYYTLDFLGGGDDAVRGERVRFDVEQGAEGYTISWARSMPLCQRGAMPDGQCV